jgi:tetratricopeptide (TPR) repeat protein
MQDGYTFIVARLLLPYAAFLTLAISCPCVSAQAKRPAASGKPSVQQPVEQEPPEEDEDLKPKEYSFNPLQAEKEMKVGNYYFKKGSYKAAQRRFREATKWNPTLAAAFLRLGEAEEKLKDPKAARDAYAKYLELAPDAKEAEQIRKRIDKAH